MKRETKYFFFREYNSKLDLIILAHFSGKEKFSSLLPSREQPHLMFLSLPWKSTPRNAFIFFSCTHTIISFRVLAILKCPLWWSILVLVFFREPDNMVGNKGQSCFYCARLFYDCVSERIENHIPVSSPEKPFPTLFKDVCGLGDSSDPTMQFLWNTGNIVESLELKIKSTLLLCHSVHMFSS